MAIIDHGMKGQTNASKELTKSSRLEIRCTEQDKAAWTKAAKGKKLAEWVTAVLNESLGATCNSRSVNPVSKGA